MTQISKALSFHGGIFFVALFIYAFTAFNSHGYYHPDEHYQVIEFAGFKSGTHAPDQLAWEFNEKIRPAVQPAICFLLFKVFTVFNATDPYEQVFLLRFLTALLSLAAIYTFVCRTVLLLNGNITKRAFIAMSYLLWFMPFLSVRFSSETWSGILFLYGLAIYNDKSRGDKVTFFAGLIMGFGFLFRFQAAFLIVGFILWLILIKKIKKAELLKFGAGLTAAFVSGILIDWWFYGELVFSSVNYFYINIIENKASIFGVSPWYFYLEKLIWAPGPVVGIAIYISIFLLFLKDRRNMYLWIILSFFLFHSIIPHKEERFLFPLIWLFPAILAAGYERLALLIKSRELKLTVNYILLIAFMVFNVPGLIVMSYKPAGFGEMEITKFIHENYRDKRVNLISVPWSNPYNPFGLKAAFYEEKNMRSTQIANLCELNDSLLIKGEESLVVVRQIYLQEKECMKKLEDNNFVLVKRSIPESVEWMNKFYQGFKSSEFLLLYRHRP